MSKEVALKEEEIKALQVETGQEEHLSKDEIELPFLRIAQKGSPQVDEDKPNFIDGLKPGMFFNTGTNEVYGDTLQVIPLIYFRNFTIWEGAKGSGEYRGSLTVEEWEAFEAENKAVLYQDGADMVMEKDNSTFRYTDTRNYLVLLPDRLDDGPILFPMSSTGIKPSKKWNLLNRTRRLNGKQAKRYATTWELKTAGFTKSDYSWKQVSSISDVGWTTGESLEMAQAFEAFAKDVATSGVKYSNDEASEVEDSDF